LFPNRYPIGNCNRPLFGTTGTGQTRNRLRYWSQPTPPPSLVALRTPIQPFCDVDGLLRSHGDTLANHSGPKSTNNVMIPLSPSNSTLKRDRLSIVSLTAINKKRREGSLADLGVQQEEQVQPEPRMLDGTRIDASCIPKIWLEVSRASSVYTIDLTL
jgi:hypothetical protein